MYTVTISQTELDKFIPFIEESIEQHTEFGFIKTMIEKYPLGNCYSNVVDYTLDSYNSLNVCMPEPTARRNSILNGLEMLISTHFVNDKDWIDSQLNGMGYDKDD